ncbi:MAG: hypothetical protein RR778_15770 [Glutamicibacter sp.]|uniref:hypothetical protein n=1 Tax=Glutamicibacter sp. TaxID=1931995 RepID=UPI002FCB1C80
MLDALGPCWWLGKECIPRWEAWAVAAAIFGGVGSWLAAFATYYAVVRPERRRREEARAVATTAMEHFAAELIEFRYRIGSVGFFMQFVTASSSPEDAKKSVSTMGRYVLVVPEIAVNTETAEIAKALGRLRRAFKTWLETVNTFDMTPIDDDPGGDIAEHAVNTLHSHFQSLMKAIRSVAALIEPIVPIYASELRLVANAGDGFLPMATPPDRL